MELVIVDDKLPPRPSIFVILNEVKNPGSGTHSLPSSPTVLTRLFGLLRVTAPMGAHSDAELLGGTTNTHTNPLTARTGVEKTRRLCEAFKGFGPTARRRRPRWI